MYMNSTGLYMYRNSTVVQMYRSGTEEQGYRCCTWVVQDYKVPGVVQR
jgi:hypothetical protein